MFRLVDTDGYVLVDTEHFRLLKAQDTGRCVRVFLGDLCGGIILALCWDKCVGFLWGSRCSDHDFIVPILFRAMKSKIVVIESLLREWE